MEEPGLVENWLREGNGEYSSSPVKSISILTCLDAQAPAQLVRVTLNGNAHLFPEISGHKNRFSIRFMDTAEAGRPVPWREDTSFTLTCCVF